jgi:dTDP-4-dehydrorhamnose reductase
VKSILITGAGGTTGRSLARYLASKAHVCSFTHAQLDIADETQVRKAVAEKKPEIVFNCAGYTRVDAAEQEPEKAHRANVEGPRILARVLAETKGKLVHLSTDYVFDGEKRTPYLPEDAVGPLSIYAQTKADGEKAVLGAGGAHLVVRVAWLFQTGGTNFLSRLKELIFRESHLRVADDRQGPCTYVPDMTEALWALAQKDARGIYHFTNEGSCSWHGFAVELIAAARRLGLPVLTEEPERISSDAFSALARRPEYSVLELGKTVELLGKRPRPWKETLRDFLLE